MSDRAALPPPTPELNLRRLVATLGSREAALRLIEARGGLTIYVPHNIDRSDLAAELGEALLSRLVAEHGGNYLRVPLAKAWRAQCYRSQGLSHAAIAARLQMTEEGVRKTLRLAGLGSTVEPDPVASPQLDLGI